MTGETSKSVMKALAERYNGVFVERKHDEQQKAKIVFEGFEIVFDYYVYYSDKPQQLFTRVVVGFTSVHNFEFELYRLSLFSRIGKFLGLIKDVEIGVREFDSKFVIKSNDGFKIKALLSIKEIRDLIEKQEKINFSISTDAGIWGGKLPENQYELSFHRGGIITDINQFDALFELFKSTLIYLKEKNAINTIS